MLFSEEDVLRIRPKLQQNYATNLKKTLAKVAEKYFYIFKTTNKNLLPYEKYGRRR